MSAAWSGSGASQFNICSPVTARLSIIPETAALVAYPPEETTCITPAESNLVSDSTVMLPPSAVILLSAELTRASSACKELLFAFIPPDTIPRLPLNAVILLSAELTRAFSADVTAVSVLPANRTAAAVFSRYLVSASEGSSPSVSGSRIMRPVRKFRLRRNLSGKLFRWMTAAAWSFRRT